MRKEIFDENYYKANKAKWIPLKKNTTHDSVAKSWGQMS